MTLENKIVLGAAGTAAAALVFSLTCAGGCWGSRGIKNAYVTQYHGKPAVVKRNDIRWGPDKYWILLDNRDKITAGTIVDDAGRKITIKAGESYSIREYNPPERE